MTIDTTKLMNFPEIYSATGMMELIQKSDLKAALYEKDSFKYHINIVFNKSLYLEIHCSAL